MKKLVFIMPLMAISLLVSCGNKGKTYTLIFNCENCKVFDETGLTEIDGSINISVVGSYNTYCKFAIKGKEEYKAPFSKSSISIKKTASGENVEFDYDAKNCMITTPVIDNLTIAISGVNKTLDQFSWAEISEISTLGRAKEFFDVYNPTKPELNCKRVQLKHQDLDNDGAIDENEVYQTVRIIGFDQDYTNPNNRDNTKVGITFEFADLISDANGYSIAAVWDNVPITNANYRYDTSTIRECLNGNISGNAVWYEKGGTTRSNNYKDSVLCMLPDDLINVIVPVSKNANINCGNGFKERPIKEPLFLLTNKEMGFEYERSEIDVPIYQYYQGYPEKDDPVILKRQVKGVEGASTTPSTIEKSELVYGGTATNYAGYVYINPTTSAIGGCRYWLRSPQIKGTSNACSIDEAIQRNDFAVFYVAAGVAPAFCI